MARKTVPKQKHRLSFGIPLLFYLNPLKWFQKSLKKYGPISVVKLPPIGETFVCLKKEHFRSILIENRANISAALTTKKTLGDFFEDGLLLADGAHHKCLRKMVQPLFDPDLFSSYRTLSLSLFDQSFAKYKTLTALSVHSEMTRLVFANATAMILGIQDLALSDKISAAYSTIMEKGVESLLRLISPLFSTQAQKANDWVKKMLHVWLADRRKEKGAPLFHRDCETLLLEVGEETFLHNLHFLLFAAHGTSSIALSFALFHLAQDAAMQSELAKFVAERPDSGFLLSDSKQPDLLDCLFFETLRLYPSVPNFCRTITQDFDLEGYRLERGKQILLSPLFVQTSEAYWQDPQKFSLRRLLDEKQQESFKSAFFPFGLGEHQCIGKHLARLLFRVIISQFLLRSKIELVEKPRIQFTGLLVPKNLKISLKLLPEDQRVL